jgi:adenylate cyclase class IV
MQNVEFKAELRDLPLARSIARALGAEPKGTLVQTDTYYTLLPPAPGKRRRIRDTRLKKRETVGAPTQWISYDRENTAAPKLSRFKIYTEEEAAEKFGPGPHPVRLVVRKSRELLMFDNVRIHLDTVEGLGTFVEFEAMVSPRHPQAACRATLATLRSALTGAMGEPIAVGYADMLEPH